MFLEKIKNVSRIAFVFGFINLVNSSPLKFVSQKLEEKTNKEAIKYVQDNLESLMIEQEIATGIKHFGKPKIDFEKEEGIDSLAQINSVAYYDEEKEIIHYPINYNLAIELTEEKKFSNNFLRAMHPEIARSIKETIWHELGHFYSQKLAQNKSEKAEENLKLIRSRNIEESLGFRIIFEGIAEYFSKRTLGDETNPFTEESWPKVLNKEKFLSDLVYRGGYHLVKEVLDFYGDDGLIYFLENPPKIINPNMDLPCYKERTMRTLECLKNQKDNFFCLSLDCPDFALKMGQFDLYSHQSQSIDGFGGNS